LIKILQVGRFLAAMAVVLHHAVESVDVFIGGVPTIVYNTLEKGYLGVDFFFVLSGFIIHFTMQKTKKSIATFALDRLLRVMLPYWPIALILALSYFLFPELSARNETGGWSWFSTITLFPTSAPPVLTVAWTLQHELIFYGIYAALLFFNKLKFGLIVWTLLILALTVSDSNVSPVLQVALAKINLEFISGIIAADLVLRSHNVKFLPSIFLSLGFLVLFIIFGSDRENSWLFGFSIAAILPWASSLEIRGKLNIPEVFVFGGAISYSIYLIHNPLLSLTSRVLHFLSFSWIEALILSALLSAFAGSAYFLIWENPVMKKYKPGGKKRSEDRS
jgi:exopolysaccharide production protein ExoZ